jgi:hypothetical protein
MGRLLRCSSVTYRLICSFLTPRRRPILNTTKLKGFRRRYTSSRGGLLVVFLRRIEGFPHPGNAFQRCLNNLGIVFLEGKF